MEQMNHIDILRSEFESRKAKNSAYSLRAYARDLGVSPSRLSEIFNERGGLSTEMADKFARKLSLKESERNLFLNIIKSKFSKSPKIRKAAQQALESYSKDKNYNSISLDGFQFVSDWYHFAILSVMELDAFNGQAKWIAQRLGIDLQLTEQALSRLKRLDLITIEGDRHKLLKNNLTTTHDISSLALRKSHRQSLQQAIETLDTVPVELRDITSMTMAIDIKKINKAKEIIKKFRRELTTYLESGEKNSVYNLNIQLVPVTKEIKK